MRRIVIITVALLVILVVAIGAAFAVVTLLGPAPVQQNTAEPAATASATPAVWDGKGEQTLALTAQRDARLMTIDQITYSYLQDRGSDVRVIVSAPSTSTGARPTWLTASAFRLSSLDFRVYGAKSFKVKRQPDTSWQATITYSNVPVSRLAAGYQADKTRALGLTSYTNTGSFRVLLLPPTPPSGHTWGETKDGEQARSRALSSRDRLQDRRARRLASGPQID